MRILVTGGGGFLGRHIIRRLLDRGDSISSIGRSPQPQLEAQGVTVVRGDLADAEVIKSACAGMDAVFHVAAKAGVWGSQEDYYAANVVGTRNVIEACRAQGVPYLVHTSTPSVVYSGESFEGADEKLPYGRDFPCHYAETKAEAEADVLAAHDADRLRTCALRPHLIWGVGDPHLLPRVIARAKSGKLRIVGDGKNRVDITHVENAALAHILALNALQSGAAGGKAYFISQGDPVALWPWINDLLQRIGVPPVERKVSRRAAYAAGVAAEAVWKVLKLQGEPPMTRFVATELSKSHWFDITAARRDLAYRPEIGTEEGMDAYVASIKGSQSAAAPNA